MENNVAIYNDNNFINIFGENKQPAIILGNFDAADENEKITFYNEVINCEKSVDTILGKSKQIKYIHIDKQRLNKPENPKGYEEVPRIIFYFTDGDAVISWSIGIYVALKRLVNVFGAPPYNFNIMFEQINKGKSRVYTISIDKNNK